MNKNSIYLYWQDAESLLWMRGGTPTESGLIKKDMLADHIGDAQVVIVLPCQPISLYEVDLAANSDKHIRASLPYALEEELASDIELNHFAYRRIAGGVHAAVVLQEQIEAWLAELDELGVKPAVLLPEACLLPANGYSLILHDEGFFMQFAGENKETLAGGLDMLPTWLQFHLDDEGLPQNTQLHVWDLRVQARDVIPVLQELEHVKVVYRGNVHVPDRVFADLIQGYQKNREINLLQGEYDNSGSFLRDTWNTYQYAVYLGLAVFVIGLLGMWLRADALEKKFRHLTQQAEQVYRSTFPNAKRVEDPKIQMQQQLKRIQDNATARANDFVAMLASVGNVLQRYGKGKIDRMTFQKGKLRIDLLVDSKQDIEQIARQLRELPDIQINRGPIQQSDTMYRANIEMVVKPQ